MNRQRKNSEQTNWTFEMKTKIRSRSLSRGLLIFHSLNGMRTKKNSRLHITPFLLPIRITWKNLRKKRTWAPCEPNSMTWSAMALSSPPAAFESLIQKCKEKYFKLWVFLKKKLKAGSDTSFAPTNTALRLMPVWRRVLIG